MKTLLRRLGLGALALLTVVSRLTATPSRPNILFVFSDDHAYQAISAYQDKRQLLETPGIDRIAREGMRFDRCLVPNSICGPSRATVLTGKYSHLNGFANNANSRFNPEQTTFPKLLQQAGYQTALIGKWHLVSEPRGFDHWQILPGQGIYYQPPFIRNGERLVEQGYVTDIITERSLEWLKQRDPSKPFLLMVQHKAPHREWSPAVRHLGHDHDRVYPEPETLFDDYENRGLAVRDQEMTLSKAFFDLDVKLTYPSTLNAEQKAAWDAYYQPRLEAFRKRPLQGRDLVRWRYQRYMHDYLGTVKAVDESVAALLKYLDERGLAENTLVVYASDQGFFLGEHGWYDKRWIFEESLRTPLLVRWPGVVKPGSVNKDIVSTLDFAQTFLEAAGVSAPGDMQGRSLVPRLKGETPPNWRKSFYYHYYEYPEPHHVRPHYGVVTDRYKLVHFYGPDVNYWELYDREVDPHELRSFYRDPAYANVIKELSAELARLRAELKVPDPDPPGFSGSMRASAALPRTNEPVLIYDFRNEADGALAKDRSGFGHDGTVLEAPKVAGRNGRKARKFSGTSRIEVVKAPGLNPAGGPWTVEAVFLPESPHGVVLARGGESHGYALYVLEGKPAFAVRIGGKLISVMADQSVVGQWTHALAVLTAQKKLRLYVNGEKVKEVELSNFILHDPAEGMQMGIDAGEAVGPYPQEQGFHGLIEQIRLINGEVPEAKVRQAAAEAGFSVQKEVAPLLPNIVIIYTDDLGYGDLSCYGATDWKTPYLDQMAAEGNRLTRFYSAQPVCSASRAALLTGTYPNRLGIHGALGPNSPIGLHPDEETLAELLKQKGYATAIFGKWHLGDAPQFLPVHQGFDEYLGLPYSNDMWPFHPERKGGFPPLPLIDGDRVVLPDLSAADQAQLTTWYTRRAVQFIKQHQNQPFFLYLAHSMPHVPLFVSDKFKGKSGGGLYGDVIQEIDWSVGQVLEALRQTGLDEQTLVIFTSDNGPWLSYGMHGGRPGPLREGKGTVWEGGVRVPFIARWPNRIPAGRVTDVPAMTIDLLPTIARLVGAPLPTRPVDGKDSWPVLAGEPEAKNPHEAYFFYFNRNELQAVLSGEWKLYLPHTYRTLGNRVGGNNGIPAKYEFVTLTEPELYNVVTDVEEKHNMIAQHPEIAQRLLALAEKARADMGDALTQRAGANVREPGRR